MDMNNNSHVNDFLAVVGWFWYSGTDAISKGEAVCYDTDYGTATANEGRRQNQVERPSLSNNKAFAGVAARDYSAKTGGQFIEAYMPGSKGVPVALAVDTVINTGVLSFVAGASGSHRGRFYTGKYLGRGSIIPRQTVTAVLEASMTGAWSVDKDDGKTITVSDTTDLSAGDTVVLVGGEKEEAADKYVKPGKYVISSITDATHLVLTASCLEGSPAADVTATGYAYTGNPTCQADLLTGDECGGVEFASLPNTGGDDQTYMVGGVTYICGGLTLAADAEFELAQGTLPGEQKAFICLGTLTTEDAVVDLASAGVQMDGSSALAEVNAINAAADAWYGQFNGAKWHTLDVVGGATEA